MNLISATSSQLLYAVVNFAYLSERHTNQMHLYFQRNSELPVDFNETLKAVTFVLVPIAASGD